MKARLIVIAAIPVLAIGLAACSSHKSESAKATSTSATTTTTTAHPSSSGQTPAPTAKPNPKPGPNPPKPVPPPPSPVPGVADVNCGPVNASNGKPATVIAIATAGGVVGCTQAITVASDYVGTPRTGDAVTVDGWTCEPQPDQGTPYICFQDDMSLGIRGGGGPATPTTPPPSPTPLPAGDVNCGTVTDAGGGARTVIAVGTPAGVAGCTEAINVASAYAQQIGTSDGATVDGWACSAQADVNAPATCTKDGLRINLLAP